MTDGYIFAIDAGNFESGYAIVSTDYEPLEVGVIDNKELENLLGCALEESFNGSQGGVLPPDGYGCVLKVVIEAVKSYGNLIGQSIIDTCVEIGRLTMICDEWCAPAELVPRKTYITDLTGDPRAKDKNIIQYLVDRFAPNTPNRGKGTKKNKGFFYGFKDDAWQAYAIAVWAIDEMKEKRAQR